MEPTVDKVGDVTVIAVNVDEFDASNADEFRRRIAPVLKDCRKLVLDLARVQFVDSRGCGLILSCLKRISPAGGGEARLVAKYELRSLATPGGPAERWWG